MSSEALERLREALAPFAALDPDEFYVEYLGIRDAVLAARAALVDEPAAATARGLPPLDTAGILWVAAIDRVPIGERIEWVKAMEERVSEINLARACGDSPAATALAEPEEPTAPASEATGADASPSPARGDSGSASAAADERPVDHRIPGSQTVNPAGSPKVARTFDLDAAADEPGETLCGS